jgi:hypothetical protein
MSRAFTIAVLVVLVALLGIVTNVVKKASMPDKPTAEQIEAANKAQQEQAKKQMQEQEVQMRRQMMEQRKKAEEQRKVMEKQAKQNRTAPRNGHLRGLAQAQNRWRGRHRQGACGNGTGAEECPASPEAHSRQTDRGGQIASRSVRPRSCSGSGAFSIQGDPCFIG